jgi:hypothetical protein
VGIFAKPNVYILGSEGIQTGYGFGVVRGEGGRGGWDTIKQSIFSSVEIIFKREYYCIYNLHI